MTKILVLEDESSIRSFILVNLKRHNFEIVEAASGEEALEKLDGTIDIALLDVMLPGISGFEVCKRAREQYPSLGIIMLTAKGQEENKIEGLELGADDYIVKPFSPKELLARINALVRRLNVADKQKDTQDNQIVSGKFVILQDERMSTVSAERILMEGGVRRENRKDYVDKMAAAFILQTYLERMNYEQEKR